MPFSAHALVLAGATAALILSPLTLPTVAQQNPRALQAHHAAWLRAFNDGSPEALRGFVREHYVAGSTETVERAVDFWLGFRLEVGPLDLLGEVSEQRPGRVAQVFWYRGRTTGAYPGIEFGLDSSPSQHIRTYGVNRAGRPAVAPRVEPVRDNELAVTLDRYFRASADSGHFSGAVAVLRDDRVVFEGAYGPADISTGRRITFDTPFRLASVTKMFTGVAIMQLIDDGKLSLDDAMVKFVPEYPPAIARQVTIRHLLTHTSGIELDDDSVFQARVSGARSIQDLLALQIERLPYMNDGRYANFTPLGRYDYSNEAIDLLAVVIERASGTPWRDYLAEQIFRRAGMTRSGADFLATPADLPVGYSVRTLGGGRRADREPVAEVGGAVAAVRPAGSGYATARDMIAFVRALTNGTLVRRETARFMMTPQVDIPLPPGSAMPCRRSYGLTMLITHCNSGVVSVGHTGGALGQSTVVEHFPALGYTIVVLSNYDRVTWWAETRLREILGVE